jgi:hypothetical protein
MNLFKKIISDISNPTPVFAWGVARDSNGNSKVDIRFMGNGIKDEVYFIDDRQSPRKLKKAKMEAIEYG